MSNTKYVQEFVRGGGVNRFKLIVGSHLHFTKLIDLGSVGSAEMWE